MFLPDLFWQQLRINRFQPAQRYNPLACLAIVILAFTSILTGLQPLNAQTTSAFKTVQNSVVADNSLKIPKKIVVKNFEIVGSSVFSQDK
ncbi:MAG: hypothetical protein ACRDBG_27080, partial [Waterburya sp.]